MDIWNHNAIVNEIAAKDRKRFWHAFNVLRGAKNLEDVLDNVRWIYDYIADKWDRHTLSCIVEDKLDYRWKARLSPYWDTIWGAAKLYAEAKFTARGIPLELVKGLGAWNQYENEYFFWKVMVFRVTGKVFRDKYWTVAFLEKAE